jgi:hypothetical protein
MSEMWPRHGFAGLGMYVSGASLEMQIMSQRYVAHMLQRALDQLFIAAIGFQKR